jgi:hypothetical protein
MLFCAWLFRAKCSVLGAFYSEGQKRKAQSIALIALSLKMEWLYPLQSGKLKAKRI